MTLVRCWISWARLYQARWLSYQGHRHLHCGLAQLTRAKHIQRIERLYHGIDQLPPNSWRVPSFGAKS